MLFPRRRSTAEELQRSVPRTPNPTLVASVAIKLLVIAAFALPFGRDAGVPWWYPLALFGGTVALLAGGWSAWNDPSRRTARTLYCAVPIAAGLLLGLTRGSGTSLDQPAALALWMLMLMGTLSLWFVIVHRHHYIEMRLRELDERAKSVEMAQRLASAQLEPHRARGRYPRAAAGARVASMPSATSVRRPCQRSPSRASTSSTATPN
jgi:hypothetical protein